MPEESSGSRSRWRLSLPTKELLWRAIYSLVSLFVGATGTVIVKRYDVSWLLVITNVFVVIGLIVVLTLFFTRLRLRIDRSSALIESAFWRIAHRRLEPQQYDIRRLHFMREKARLARVLVQEELPHLCQRICERSPGAKFRIILDSGTTITPVFDNMVRFGIKRPKRGAKFDVQFHTNNLESVIEIENATKAIDNPKFAETDFNLIGGNPLSKYRATTGRMTEEYLKLLRERPWGECNSDERAEVVTIGVLTSNWILCGPNYDRIILCARGRGHPEFKRIVAQHADYLVIVTPLGKLVKLTSVAELRYLYSKFDDDPRHPYQEVYLPVQSEDRLPTLLTTYRYPDSFSPLVNMSNSIRDDRGRAFVLSQHNQMLRIPGSRDEVFYTDLPHEWTRQFVRELYGGMQPH